MTLKEAYELMGGDYDSAMTLLRKEERVTRYLGMFLKDDSFALLQSSMEKDDMETAFRAAHTLKGVTANLSLTRLQQAAGALTEDLRNGHDIPHAKVAYPDVAACYEATVAVIRQLIG